MPPKFGLYSLQNTPEELSAEGYGPYSTEFDYDPVFGSLAYNTSYNPAPYTGNLPFQNVFRISEGAYNNFDNPSFGGSSNPRFDQFGKDVDFINAPQDYYGGISSLDPQQKFQFLSSAYEDDDEEQVESLTGEKKSGGIADLLRAALGFVIPGANLFLNKGRDAMSGIRSLNQRLRNTDFGQSSSLADYLDARSYGGRQERDDAAARNMAQARGIQKRIDKGDFNRDTSGITDRGRGSTPSRSTPSRSGRDTSSSSSYSQASYGRRR